MRVRVGSHLSRHEIKLRKKTLSAGVYLFPRPLGITIVGGVGERDGGSGIVIWALGGGKRSSKTGICVVRLLIVFRRLVDGFGSEVGWIEWRERLFDTG